MKNTICILFFLIPAFLCSEIIRQEMRIALPNVQQVFPVDLDNDRDLDLIVLHRMDSPLFSSRYVSLFLQNNANFSQQPDMQYTADARDIIIDWADMDGDGFTELLLIRPDGIVAWRPQYPDTIQILLHTTPLLSGADPERLMHWPFLWDIDGDRSMEILIHENNGLGIFSKDSLGQYQKIRTLNMNPGYKLFAEETLMMQTSLPRLELQDMNNDRRPDIVLLHEDRMDLFLSQDASDIIASDPIQPDQQIRFALDDSHLSMLEAFAPAEASLQVDDLNGDGYGDVSLSRASKASFTKNQSQLQLYYSNGGKFKPLPDQVLLADNFFRDHRIADFNNDGREDIALLQFPIGLVRAAKFLLTRRMKYGFDIYYQDNKGHFHDLPNQKLRFTRHSKLRNVLRPELFTFSDWNGDGRLDIVVNIDHQHIVGFIQNENGIFPKKPNFKIKIPVSPQNWTGDLNNDQQSDILLWYGDTGEIRSLISRE